MSKPKSHRTAAPGVPATVLILLSALLASACGLGMSTEDRLARAEGALQSGETRAAIIDAKNILLDEPDHVQARLLLGRASLADGDGATAEKALRRAVAMGVPLADVAVDLAQAMQLQGKYDAIVDEFDPSVLPEGPERRAMLLVLGDTRLALRQAASARELYASVLASDPTDRAAQLGVAHSYIAEQNLMQARETLSRVLELNDDFGQAWLTSARLYMSARNFAAAEQDFDRARQVADADGDLPLQVQAVYGLAEASLALDKLEAARKHSTRLEALAPNTIATMQIAARVAYADANWAVAQEKLAEVLRRAPDNNMARMLLGAVHLQSGNLGQAEMYLSAAVANEPRNADARRLLAETRLQLNKSGEAQRALQPLLDAENADPRSLAMAARVNLLSGDFEGAAEYLERSAAEHPATANVQLDLAVAYIMAGRVHDAQAVLDAAPDDDSEDSAFRRDALRALTLSRTEGMDAALAEGAALRQKWPGRAMAHVLHGAMLMSTGDMDEARAAFTTAQEIAPGDVNSLRYLARIDEAGKDWSAAAGRYRQILELNSADVHAMFALGRMAARNEQTAEAIDWLEKARAADGSVVAPRLVLSKLYISERRFEDAELVAQEAIAVNDGVADLHNTMGVVHLGRQQTAAATKSFARAVELDPDNRDYRINLARAHGASGNAEQALSAMEAGNKDLQHLPTGVMLARVQLHAGNAQGALETARALRRLHAGDAVPIALEAELLAHGGDLAGAIRVYDEALAVEPTRRVAMLAHDARLRANDADADQPLLRFLEERPLNTDVRVLLAQYYHQHDMLDKAMAEYRHVLESDPTHFVSVNNLAWLYFTGDDPRAEATARQALALAPQNASVIDTLGWILVGKNKLTEGVELLREAVALGDRPEVRYHLAAALAASGEVGEARRLLEEILDADKEFPSRDEARTLLASL